VRKWVLNDKLSILALTQKEYSEGVYDLLGRGKHHANLLYREFYHTGYLKGLASDFTGSTKVLLREIVVATFISTLKIASCQSEDSVVKYLLRTEDSQFIESVLVPMQSGYTLCLSSQVGCSRGCAFCETAKMGLTRNLTVEEIVAQVYQLQVHEGYSINNIVFMGMGEPMDNYDNVMQAIRVLTDQGGLAFGCRSITVSTCGHVPNIERFTQEAPAALNLAVSINASNDIIRSKIMPINNLYPMADIKKALEKYCSTGKRKVLIGYVLLRNFNDSLTSAEELAVYLQGLDVKVNVIPYNGEKGLWAASTTPQTEGFIGILRAVGLQVLLRRTKGSSIEAGCGQLRAEFQ